MAQTPLPIEGGSDITHETLKAILRAPLFGSLGFAHSLADTAPP